MAVTAALTKSFGRYKASQTLIPLACGMSAPMAKRDIPEPSTYR
jgi:hypothetical protein